MEYKETSIIKENNDWKDKIVVMVYVKEELRRLDKLGIWSHHLPEVAAIEEQLVEAEAYLGHSIDKGYKNFLMNANGWKSFYQTVDLFGTNDLINSDSMGYELTSLDATEDKVR